VLLLNSISHSFHSKVLGSLRVAIAVTFLAVVALPLVSGAATISATATPFTGDSLSVTLEVDDAEDPGNLVITLSVDGGDIGDLRGLFLNVTDESLLSGLSVSGHEVTESAYSANSVINLGGGNNLNGGGSPCPCDIGFEFGSPGIGHDDLQSVTLTLSHAAEELDVSLFSDETFGVRATSVGDSRNGSSKLISVVPEPSTAMLMLLGLGGLARMRTGTRTLR
jgi:hypothetical protein